MDEDDWKRLIGGAFAGETAPFAVHPNDKKRAKKYFEQAKAEGLSVSDAVRHAKLHLENATGWPTDIDKQLAAVRKYFTGKLVD